MAWFGFKEAAGGWRMVYPFRRVRARQRLRRPWPGRLRAEVQPA